MAKGVGSWGGSPGSYIEAAAAIDETDKVVIEVEQRWGFGRVRLLVDEALRAKADRQRYLWNQAVWHGDLADIQREAPRTRAAWKAMDKAALASGAEFADPQAWEQPMPDGSVLVMARTSNEMQAWLAKGLQAGRRVQLWSLEEIGQLVAEGLLGQAKLTFPGAQIVPSRTSIEDPLSALNADGDDIDDIPF